MGWSPFRPVGLTYKNDRTFGGYTLITPIGGDSTYLLDEDGLVVHRWSAAGFRPGYGFLLPGGTLLVRGQALEETDQGMVPIPGKADILLELDWDSHILWRWEEGDLHHDMCRLPNGNTLVLVWEPLPQEIGDKIKGGLNESDLEEILKADPDFLSFLLQGVGVGGRPKMTGRHADAIVEVNPSGEIIRTWHAYEHFDPDAGSPCPFCPDVEWTHANALGLTADGGVLISFREMSEVMKIDWETGKVLWRFGKPVISHQHDPTETPDGNILIFDNGTHHPIQGRTRIIEVDPHTNRIVWQYTGSPVFSLMCMHIGGAQRLANGNTLICEGESGRIFEVTPDKEICWEWCSPFVHKFKGSDNVQIFKAHRYTAKDPELQGKDLSAKGWDAFNEQWKLTRKE